MAMVKLTKVERYQIKLAIQSRLNDPHVDDNEKEILESHMEIVTRGYEGFYSDLDEDIFATKSVSKNVSDFVIEVLEMYRHIYHSIVSLEKSNLPKPDKDWIKANRELLKYPGWDANNNEEYGISRHLFKRGLWEELSGGPWDSSNGGNSHSSGTKDQYRRMLEKYKSFGSFFSSTSGNFKRRSLTIDELKELIKA